MSTVKGTGNTKPAISSNTTLLLFPFSFVALSLPVRAVHRLLSLPCALSAAVSYILKESSVLFIRISQPWNRVWHMVDAQRILVESMLMLN